MKRLAGTLALAALASALAARGDAVAKIGETEYETLEAAIKAATADDVIVLGEGVYTTYGTTYAQGKTLTFEGQGADKTTWNHGASTTSGDEYKADYSIENATVTFRKIGFHDNASTSANYRGFIRAAGLLFERCSFDGNTHYQGSGTTIFRNCTFQDTGAYCITTYSAAEYVFDGCTFYSSKGKFVNVYKEGGASLTKVYVNDCTFTVAKDASSAVGTSSNAKYACLYVKTENPWEVYFTGDNKANGVLPGSVTGDVLYNDNKLGTTTSVYEGGVLAYGEDGEPVVTGAKLVWSEGAAYVAPSTEDVNTVQTDNLLGALKVVGAAGNVFVAAPFESFDGDAAKATDTVQAAGLDGDRLYAWDGTQYNAWTSDGAAWKEARKVTVTQGAEGDVQSSEGNSGADAVAVGGGLLLSRADSGATATVYVYGQVPGESDAVVSVSADAGTTRTLVSPVGEAATKPLDLNDFEWTGVKESSGRGKLLKQLGDHIYFRDAEGKVVQFFYYNGRWGEIKGGLFDAEGGAVVPAGTAFWYGNDSGIASGVTAAAK